MIRLLEKKLQDVEPGLFDACPVDGCTREDFERELANGSTLYKVCDGDKELALLMCRPDGDEIEIHSAFDHARERFDLTEHVLPYAVELFAKEGYKSIRFGTLRPGLVHRAKSMGWRIAEVLMRIEVPE